MSLTSNPVRRNLPYAIGVLLVVAPALVMKLFFTPMEVRRLNIVTLLSWWLIPSFLSGALVGWFEVRRWRELPKTLIPVGGIVLLSLGNLRASDAAPVGALMFAVSQIPVALIGGFVACSFKREL